MKYAVATLAAVVGLTAFADGGATWYLKDSETKFWNWMDNAVGWTDDGKTTGTPSGDDGDSLSPDDYYVVNKGHAIRSNKTDDPNGAPTIFKGKRLTIGEDGSKNSGSMTCYSRGKAYVDFGSQEGQEGVYLYRGVIGGQKNYGGNHYNASFTGKMTLTAPESAPFVFTSYQKTTDGTHAFLVTGTTFLAESGTALQVGGLATSTDYTATNFTMRFYCDMSQFFGKIIVKPCCSSAEDYPFVRSLVYFGDGGFSGTLEVQDGASLVATGAQHVVTLANATFATGSTIKLPTAFTGSGAASCARVVVTNSLTLGDNVAIEITPPANGLTNRLAVLVSKNGGIDKTKFSFKLPDTMSPWFESIGGAWFEVETNQATGEQTLYAVCVPLVRMIYSDKTEKTSGPTRLAITNAAAWSDGRLPHSGAHYLIDTGSDVTGKTSNKTYFSTAKGNVEYRFPGDSLTFSSGTMGMIFCTGFSVPVLRMRDGTTLWNGQSVTVSYSNMQFIAESGVVELTAFNNAAFNMYGDLSGEAEVRLGTLVSSSVPKGNYRFYGDNADFAGTFVVSQYIQSAQYGGTYSARYQELLITNSLAFGGALPAFNPEALVLSEYGRITLENRDVSISTNLNRGLAVYGNGVVSTKTYTFDLGSSPIDLSSGFFKVSLEK